MPRFHLMKAVIVAFFLLMAAGLSDGQGSEEVNQLAEEFDFTSAVRKGEAGPVSGGKVEPEMLLVEADRLTHEYRMTQERNKLYLCGFLILLAALSLLIVLRFITRTSYTAWHIINASGLVLIIFATVLLVLLVDAEAQLTASMGILGAIAGYLFGTMRREEGRVKPVREKSGEGDSEIFP